MRSSPTNSSPSLIQTRIITCSIHYSLELICKLFPESSRVLAIEDPGFDGARSVFIQNGYQICSIPLDNEGIRISILKQSSAKLVYVTPSHQFPMGIMMPIARRLQLLRWAQENNAYIIEDDYDSEYRYHSRSVPALRSIDTQNRVIYIGSFAKSLAPGLHVSYMVLPDHLLEQYHRVFRRYHGVVSQFQQHALALFMEKGYYRRHLRKNSLIYRNKHDLLVSELYKHFQDRIMIHGINAGLHIVLEFLDGKTEDYLIQAAKNIGVRVYPVSAYAYSAQNKTENMVLLGFGLLTEKEIKDSVRLLAEAWR